MDEIQRKLDRIDKQLSGGLQYHKKGDYKMNSNANNKKIARFIDINACKQVFSESYSTFLIRSHKYYWHIENTDKQDRHEFQVQGEKCTMEAGSGLLSCWTILDDDKPTDEEWKIFVKDSPAVAIVSRPTKVYDFLYKILDIESTNGRTYPFFRIINNKVNYNDKIKDKDKRKNKPTIYDAIFTKDEKFKDEKEYRFVVLYRHMIHEINTYILHVQDPYEYVESFYFNPHINSKKANELHIIINSAISNSGPLHGKKLCEIIANSDDLFVSISNNKN